MLLKFNSLTKIEILCKDTNKRAQYKIKDLLFLLSRESIFGEAKDSGYFGNFQIFKTIALEITAYCLYPILDVIAEIREEIDACELLDFIYVRGVLEQTATVMTAVFVDEADGLRTVLHAEDDLEEPFGHHHLLSADGTMNALVQ